MRARFVCILIVLALSAMLLAGCSSGGNKNQPEPTAAPTQAQQADAEVTEPPSNTPVPPAEEATTAPEPTAETEEEEAEEQVYFSELDDLAQLNSYRVRTVIRWEDTNGETGSMDLMVEFTRDPLAQRMVISNAENEEVENMEMISIGDTAYMRVGGEDWFSIQSEDTSVEEIGQIWAPEDFLGGGDAEYLGIETINGVETKHYRYKESAFVPGAGFTAIDKAEGEVWVSTKHNVYVRAIMHIEGHDADGVKGTFDMESNLEAINEPITISAPEGVAKPGLPDDIPLMEGATEVSAFGQMVSFTVEKPVSDVAAYYKEAMKDNGWTMGESIIEEMQNYTKDGRTATIMISQAEEENANKSSVVIMVEEPTAE